MNLHVACALSLWPAEGTPPKYDGEAQTKPLTDAVLVKPLETLPKQLFLARQEGLRLSLAGAQVKVQVVLVDERIALPVPGQPTTHRQNLEERPKSPVGSFRYSRCAASTAA